MRMERNSCGDYYRTRVTAAERSPALVGAVDANDHDFPGGARVYIGVLHCRTLLYRSPGLIVRSGSP